MKLELLTILPFGKKSLAKIRASQGSEVLLDKFVEIDRPLKKRRRKAKRQKSKPACD